MRITVLLSSLLFALVLVGCPSAPPGDDGGGPGRQDAGANDAGDNGDAGASDGGSDAGNQDAGASDAGDDDAGASDGGENDSGLPDTPEGITAHLCQMYLDGARVQYALVIRSLSLLFSGARCSADDPIPDSSENLPDAYCAPGGPFYDTLYEAVTGGRVSIDLEKLNACLANIREVRGPLITFGDLDNSFALLPAVLLGDENCTGAITPLRAEGEVCRQHWDCPAGTLCEAPTFDAAELRCMAPAEVGEACANGPESASDALTPGNVRSCALGSLCIGDVCVAQPTENESCDPYSDELPCLDGLFCDPVDLTCQLLRGPGEDCFSDSECADGLRCGADGCEAPLALGDECTPGEDAACEGTCTVCRPASTGSDTWRCLDRGGLGDACDTLNHCRDGLVCGADGTCNSGAVLGESCNNANPCSRGLVCIGGECREMIERGESCEFDAQCGPDAMGCIGGLCAHGRQGDTCYTSSDCNTSLACVRALVDESTLEEVGTCAPPPGVGDACTTLNDICNGSVCVDGTCVAYGNVGEACVLGKCRAGAYCGLDDVCVALHAPGEACVDDSQCLSQLCLESTNTCSAVPADSCLSSNVQFLQIVAFSLLVPFSIRRLRRRERRQQERANG